MAEELVETQPADLDACFAIARHVAQQWISNRKMFRSPLLARDGITLQCSTLLYPTRLWLQSERAVLDRLLPAASTARVETAAI
jgi:hypothetical protein